MKHTTRNEEGGTLKSSTAAMIEKWTKKQQETGVMEFKVMTRLLKHKKQEGSGKTSCFQVRKETQELKREMMDYFFLHATPKVFFWRNRTCSSASASKQKPKSI